MDTSLLVFCFVIYSSIKINSLRAFKISKITFYEDRYNNYRAISIFPVDLYWPLNAIFILWNLKFVFVDFVSPLSWRPPSVKRKFAHAVLVNFIERQWLAKRQGFIGRHSVLERKSYFKSGFPVRHMLSGSIIHCQMKLFRRKYVIMRYSYLKRDSPYKDSCSQEFSLWCTVVVKWKIVCRKSSAQTHYCKEKCLV